MQDCNSYTTKVTVIVPSALQPTDRPWHVIALVFRSCRFSFISYIKDEWLHTDFFGIIKFGLISMVLEPVCCPHCGSDDVGRHGESHEGKKRYIRNNGKCSHSGMRRNRSLPPSFQVCSEGRKEGKPSENVHSRDAMTEPTWMYSRRFSEGSPFFLPGV